MPRRRTDHRCTDCGGTSPTWLGRCPTCGEWNTLVEEPVPPTTPHSGPRAGSPAPGLVQPIGEVDIAACGARSTGVGELDRVLGGGLVPGSVTLLGGEPGTGKSTLLLQAAAAMARSSARCLIVTAEESAQQVRQRAERLGAVAADLHLVAETNLAWILSHLAEVEPDVVVVDSAQTIYDPEIPSAPGSVAQVRECAHRLVREAKERGTAVLLVGHVTKEGALAGPRVLEHVVDTVLSFEGDRHHGLRLLRAAKHRFGPTHELGLFEMGEQGLVGVPDPSGLFLADRRTGEPGSVVVATVEGHRPLLVELQALVCSSNNPHPRRSALGLDSGRLALLLAVLEQRAGVPFGTHDVHASAVGGVRVLEPAADLALALALASAVDGCPVAGDVVACGEVGLAGEVRQVGHLPRRLAEAARLGFRRAIVPASAPEGPPEVSLIRVGTVGDAIAAVRRPMLVPSER